MRSTVKNLFTSKKVAFTLAEVLITLGIIGIVSAITLPIINTAYNNHITETRLKKFYSTFNQAIEHSVADNGDVNNWNYIFGGASIIVNGTLEAKDDYTSSLVGNFKKYLAPYLNIVDEKEMRWSSHSNRKVHLYYFNDGSAIGHNLIHNRDYYYFPKNPEKCLNLIDTKALCAFEFTFYPNAQNDDSHWKNVNRNRLEPYKYNWDGTKEYLYNNCENSKVGYFCAALIQYNGWKIPNDFPRKIKY